MIRILFILLMIFLFLSGQGQEKTAINIEVGLPFCTKNIYESHYKHTLIGLPHVSIDKPFFIKIKEKEKISINPGLGYFGFKEKKESEGLGGQSSSLLNHTSLNVFTKASLQNNFNKNNFYFGALFGLHFYTKTKGIRTNQGSYQNPPISSKYEINKSGKDFFNPIYYGFFIGLKSKSLSKVFSHSFELSYFPNFIKFDQKREGIIQFSVIFSFYRKKEKL